MTPKERRQVRQKEKVASEEQKKVRLQNKLIQPDEKKPRFVPLLDQQKAPLPKAVIEGLDVPRQPRAEKTGSRFGLLMSWCARVADVEGSWGWGSAREWSQSDWDDVICPQLNNLQGLDWSEIQTMSSDTGHLMHHDHDVCSLTGEAVERWLQLKYEEFDTIFRFRLGNLRRAWGIVLGGHFYMIWWDSSHQIYPV